MIFSLKQENRTGELKEPLARLLAMLETFFLTLTLIMLYMYLGSRYPPQFAKRITWLDKEAGKSSVFKKGGKLATPFNCLIIRTKKMGENTF